MPFVTIRRKEDALTDGSEGTLSALCDLLEEKLPSIVGMGGGIEFDTPFFDKSARHVPDVRVEVEGHAYLERDEDRIASQLRTAIDSSGIVPEDVLLQIAVKPPRLGVA